MSKTRQSFPLTPLLYIWILLHCVVLMVGAKYTYAEVPLFDWISEIFGWERNNYDKVGHFMQGLVPALIAREIFLGKEGSGEYEWLAKFNCPFQLLGIQRLLRIDRMVGGFAVGEDADAFLGAQEYIWDTQSDLGLALLGTICCLLIIQKEHDRQIKRLLS